ncbi:hypothetical protein PsYK624_050280 [Phanerochaete sordida]|uniref:Uncharacterized protein n=1 Tax=Phanerochaete sordida TaxID=48140 RepID=A0A9P3G6X9_9APHY|nr:hypothetical protein PsYK624_050280 [Phanerochaete sordida]
MSLHLRDAVFSQCTKIVPLKSDKCLSDVSQGCCAQSTSTAEDVRDKSCRGSAGVPFSFFNISSRRSVGLRTHLLVMWPSRRWTSNQSLALENIRDRDYA